MAQDVCVIVGAEDRARLAAVVGDRRRPLKHVQRARIVLASANRLPVAEVARRAGVSRPAVWRWQLRYGESLFVVSRDEDKLYKVSAADLSVQGEVATGDQPHGVAYRPTIPSVRKAAQ